MTTEDDSPIAEPPDARAAPIPLREIRSRTPFSRVRVLATDVDGTLTTAGELAPEAVATIGDLVQAGIRVVPVSGRSAGEVLGLTRYLPGVSEGIAENGQVLVMPDRPVRRLIAERDRAELKRIGNEVLLALGLDLRLAPDDFCRVGDVAFERAKLGLDELGRLQRGAAERGIHVIWSSVHVHLSWDPPDKGAALVGLLEEWKVSADAVATLGDAPNDAGLFRRDRFAVTVGTADILGVLGILDEAPLYVSSFAEGRAFRELANLLLGTGPSARDEDD